MSILVNDETRILVQGIAGRAGAFYTRRMMSYGTKIVAGVSPGQGGTWFADVPVFDTVREAVEATDANASLIYLRAGEVADGILEAVAAGIELIVCFTHEVPVRDMMAVKAYLAAVERERPVHLIGPGSPGVFSPGQCTVGVAPEHIFKSGRVGVVSRSGSLAYEITWLLTQAGLGQSTVLGIGGGQIVGTGFVQVLAMFEDDPVTEQVVLIGEIGGDEEERAAAFAERMTKPVVAFIAGQTAPPGRRMGHEGAIIEGYVGSAQHKIEALERVGVRVASSPEEIPRLLAEFANPA